MRILRPVSGVRGSHGGAHTRLRRRQRGMDEGSQRGCHCHRPRFPRGSGHFVRAPSVASCKSCTGLVRSAARAAAAPRSLDVRDRPSGAGAVRVDSCNALQPSDAPGRDRSPRASRPGRAAERSIRTKRSRALAHRSPAPPVRSRAASCATRSIRPAKPARSCRRRRRCCAFRAADARRCRRGATSVDARVPNAATAPPGNFPNVIDELRGPQESAGTGRTFAGLPRLRDGTPLGTTTSRSRRSAAPIDHAGHHRKRTRRAPAKPVATRALAAGQARRPVAPARRGARRGVRLDRARQRAARARARRRAAARRGGAGLRRAGRGGARARRGVGPRLVTPRPDRGRGRARRGAGAERAARAAARQRRSCAHWPCSIPREACSRGDARTARRRGGRRTVDEGGGARRDRAVRAAARAGRGGVRDRHADRRRRRRRARRGAGRRVPVGADRRRAAARAARPRGTRPRRVDPRGRPVGPRDRRRLVAGAAGVRRSQPRRRRLALARARDREGTSLVRARARGRCAGRLRADRAVASRARGTRRAADRRGDRPRATAAAPSDPDAGRGAGRGPRTRDDHRAAPRAPDPRAHRGDPRAREDGHTPAAGRHHVARRDR